MRQILLIYLALVCKLTLCYATPLNQNNSETGSIWKGDISKFKFSTNESFSLNAPAATGSAYIYHPLEFTPIIEWSMDIQMDFNPSAQNLTRIYLLNESIGQDNGTAYYLEIGGTKDNFRLIKQSSKNKLTTLASGKDKRLDKATIRASLNIKLSNNKWTVYSKLSGESLFTQECEYEMKEPINSNQLYYTGILCKYTSTRSKLFRFSNVTTQTGAEELPIPPTEEPDSETSELVELSAESDSLIILTFSNKVKTDYAFFSILNYTDARISKTSTDQKSIYLLLKKPLISGNSYELFWSGLYDYQNEYVECPTPIFDFIIEEDEEDPTLPDPPISQTEYGDVVFTEIMANSKSNTFINETEFIEVLNRSNKTLSTKEWTLIYGTTTYQLPTSLIEPGAYVVLTKKGASIPNIDPKQLLQIDNFPTLSNTGKYIELKNGSGETIHWTEYHSGYYGNAINTQGVSMECIDPNNLSDEYGNWIAATNSNKCSPGKLNSVNGANPDKTIPYIKSTNIENNTVSIAISESVNTNDLLDINRYNVNKSEYQIISISTNKPRNNRINLAFNRSVEQADLTIELPILTDLNKNKQLISEKIKLGKQITIQPEDLLINEVMYEPDQSNAEYLELYNNTEESIELSEIGVVTNNNTTADKINTIGPATIASKAYLVLTTKPEIIHENYPESTPENTIQYKLPQLNNVGATIYIINKTTGETIDYVGYMPSWHTVKNKRNIALERVSVEEASNNPSNWKSALESKGGTPGAKNSDQSDSEDENNTPDSQYSKPTIRNNENTIEINYGVSDANTKCSAYIFSSSGILISQILNNENVSPTGLYVWNKNETSKKITLGIYILLWEYYKPNGESVKYKIPFVIR
ncbi:MAG: lamin tail domain-containing protein [Tannerellaceae bacterium]